jgi:hypothetical protein
MHACAGEEFRNEPLPNCDFHVRIEVRTKETWSVIATAIQATAQKASQP